MDCQGSIKFQLRFLLLACTCCRHAAIDSRRDIKKALQQFGRSRPDIILQLPQQLLADVASQQFSERMDRKAQVALQRLKADTAQLQPSATSTTAHATGRASTQDILRVLWVLVDTIDAAATQADSAPTPDSSTTTSSDATGEHSISCVGGTQLRVVPSWKTGSWLYNSAFGLTEFGKFCVACGGTAAFMPPALSSLAAWGLQCCLPAAP